MPLFPRNEDEIILLTKTIADRLTDDDEFPSIPANKSVLNGLLADYYESRTATENHKLAMRKAREKKNQTLKLIIRAARDDLSFLMLLFRKEPGKLGLFGWGKRRSRHKSEVPGQPRHLEILRIEGDIIYLDWKSPMDGGKVSAYIVKRLIQGETEFRDVHTIAKTEAKLMNQPRGVRLTFMVVAMNKAGESIGTNSVDVVL